ncbi:uncharacterized protein LOC117595911 isoform X2 [Pangasianodon hypophthalmus]|uniref:uncharacterized protein LOC117595911 isoform X2 n=1 Tax=Pangasianodon hypophthalmus TaxID=310915 RepID=UPI0023074192|nr:uncharacterized protein LOC117595911 isoform X2 [Pangasianodon hypophthalmus]
MQSCSIHHCVLFFLTLTFTTAPVSAAVCSTTVKLHQSVTLSCEYKCSGSVKWALFNNRDVVLARCNKTSCSSLKKGYEMSHDQYLKGDLSLTITAADYSKRNTYACECGISEISTVRLSIETVFSAVQMNPGEDLILDLSVPEPVEVIYKSRDSAVGEQICTVTQRSLQCKAEYTHRTSLSHPELTLRDVQPSDSGSYTIRDLKNNEDLRVYTVSVAGERIPWWITVLLIVLLVVILLLALTGFIKYQKNAVHREFLKVSKQLEHVNKLIQQAERGNEQVSEAEEAMKELEQQYRENPKYSEQIKLFCKAKRAELKQRSGEEGEGLLLTERGGMLRKMEEVINSLQRLSGDGAEHLQDTSSGNIAETENDLAEIEQWCREKRAELNNLVQQRRGGEPEGTSGGNQTVVQREESEAP